MSKSKAEQRKQLKLAVDALADEEKREGSQAMAERLRQQPLWAEVSILLGYWPRPDEPDIRPLLEIAIREGKTVLLPSWDPETGQYVARQVTDLNTGLVTGKYDIPEPKPENPVLSLKRLDLALVPGVGFSLLGCRLGRGKGFYDRLLNRSAGANCGVAFDCQVGVEVRTEPHDVCMNWILTPTRWLSCPHSSAS